MLDFFFAMIAAGANAGGSDNGSNTAVAIATPAPAVVAAPSTDTAIATSPTVNMGENVNIGSGVIIGGNAATTPDSGASGGGLSLLDGTSDSGTQPLMATPAAPAAPAAPSTAGFNMVVVPAGLVAEPQEPTGKFTTAVEVKPIMNATKGNWVAVREYDGKDLLYVTHIWGWRCGLKAMAISVNGEAMQNWPLPPCHMKYSTPNAVLEEDGLPYLSLRLGAVQTIDIQIVYDDLSMDAASFERGNVLIP